MPDALVLARHPALPPAQDYAGLREEGLGHLRALAGARWTDHNVHDPGVTILEALCYGLTDLGYRAGFPVADLLASSGGGTVHSARDVLPTAAVTFDDLRRRLVDVPGVADAFVEPHARTTYGVADGELVDPGDDVTVGGLLDVSLVLEPRVGRGPVERVGLAEALAEATGGPAPPLSNGVVFDATEAAVIESVAVYAQAPEGAPAGTAATFVVELVDAEGAVLAAVDAEVPPPLLGEKVCVPLGFEVAPGTGYKLRARGAGARLYREAPATTTATYGRAVRFAVGPGEAQGRYFFFYDWRVRARRMEGAVLDRDAVLAEVRQRLDADRGLCQDVATVCVVEPEEIGLCAEIEVVPGADLAEVLARVHHALERHVAPPVRFYTVGELLARGHAVDRIFEGPLLDHGFLDPDEWAARRRRCRIQASDLIGLALQVEGVESVRAASVLSYVDGEPREQQPWVLDLVGGRTPVYSPARSSLATYERGLPAVPDRARVAERLAALRRTDRPGRLQAHAQDLPVPTGEDMETADYWPVQNDLPPTYAVGRTPVRATATARRKAQSAQLKAYLLFFEQVLADAFAQLGAVGDLFSWATSDGPTYAVQPVGHVHGVDALYAAEPVFAEGPAFDLAAELRAITESADDAVGRRLRLLEHLLARLGASFEEYERVQGAGARARVAEDKRRYLEGAPALDAERALGADVSDADGLGGYARRVYALLGLRDATRRRLANPRVRIVGEVATRGAATVVEARFVVEDEGGAVLLAGRPVVVAEAVDLGEARDHRQPGDVCVVEGVFPGALPPVGSSVDACAASEPACRAVTQLLDLALSLGADEASYQEDGGVWHLVHACSADAEDPPDVLGAVTASADPADVRAAFAEAAVGPGDEGFHVVEHVLLRPRSGADPFLPLQTAPGCDEVVDPYTFRASVVLPAWPPRFRDLAFRRFVEATLRREAPAHVALRVCWVSHHQMRAFEEAQDAWRDALAGVRRLGCPGGAPAPAAGPCAEAAASATITDAAVAGPLRTGVPPLPPAAPPDAALAAALGALSDALFSLVTVYPAARLHDCGAAGSPDDVRPVTLGATQLGSL